MPKAEVVSMPFEDGSEGSTSQEIQEASRI